MFLITIKQVSILLIYILAGYLLVKTKILKKSSSKTIAGLLVYFVSPLYGINASIKNMSIEHIVDYIILIFAGTILLLVLLVFSHLISKVFAKNNIENGIYNYLFAFSNYGYFGYPLVSAVFGDEVLFEFMMFCFTIGLAINSYGYFILTKEAGSQNGDGTKAKMKNPLRCLYTPPMIATYLGWALALLPIEMPQFFFDVVSPAVNCYNALPMILMGIVLGSVPLKSLFTSVRPYIVSLIRLVGMPLVFGGIALLLYKFCGISQSMFICIVVMASLPAGMNVIVFPETVGLDSTEGAKTCFISYIMALVTVPCVFMLIEYFL